MSLLDNLVSYWKLDEASGDAVDAHGSNTLTDQNTVGSAAGKINNARDFETDNSEYFSHADNADLSTGDIDFTIAAWVNAESFAAFNTIIAKSGANLEYLLRYSVVYSSFMFRVEDGGGNQGELGSTFGTPSTGTWYFVVAWHDASANTINIQVNNGSVDSTSHTTGVRDGTNDMNLGAESTISRWDGLIDEVGFWKRVLTSQERTDLYNSGNGLPYSDFGGATPGMGVPVLRWAYELFDDEPRLEVFVTPVAEGAGSALSSSTTSAVGISQSRAAGQDALAPAVSGGAGIAGVGRDLGTAAVAGGAAVAGAGSVVAPGVAAAGGAAQARTTGSAAITSATQAVFAAQAHVSGVSAVVATAQATGVAQSRVVGAVLATPAAVATGSAAVTGAGDCLGYGSVAAVGVSTVRAAGTTIGQSQAAAPFAAQVRVAGSSALALAVQATGISQARGIGAALATPAVVAIGNTAAAGSEAGQVLGGASVAAVAVVQTRQIGAAAGQVTASASAVSQAHQTGQALGAGFAVAAGYAAVRVSGSVVATPTVAAAGAAQVRAPGVAVAVPTVLAASIAQVRVSGTSWGLSFLWAVSVPTQFPQWIGTIIPSSRVDLATIPGERIEGSVTAQRLDVPTILIDWRDVPI